MDPYVSVLYEIVTRGLNTNSYKFALWRALARLAPTTDERSPKIFKRDLSVSRTLRVECLITMTSSPLGLNEKPSTMSSLASIPCTAHQ